MKKTSIYLEEPLDEALARRASEEGITKAQFIRRTLSSAVKAPARAKVGVVGIIDGSATAKGAASDDASAADAQLTKTGFAS